MAEVIVLSDSSDDEGHEQAVFNDTRSAIPQPNQAQVISLLDSDDEPSSSSSSVVAKNRPLPASRKGKSKLKKSSFASKYASSLDSDSDDSLDQYQESGLSKGARKRQRTNSGVQLQTSPSEEDGIQMFSPHATSVIRKVTPLQPNGMDSNTTRVISQEMVDMANTPCSQETDTSSTSTTPRLAQHDSAMMQPRRIMVNPYTKTKAKSPPTVAATTTLRHTQVSTSQMIANPYTRKSPPKATPPSSSQEDDPFPFRLTKNSKTYPDLRAKLALCLWRYSRSLAHSSYQRGRLAQTIPKLVAISCIAEHPIRSLPEYLLRFQAQSIEAVSLMNQKVKDLTEQLQKGGWDTVSTPIDACSTGQYFTIAEACLVVCKKKLQPLLSANGNLEDELKQKEHYLSLSAILPEIDRHLRPECPASIARLQDEDNGVQFYQQSSTISAEYLQIKRLCALDYIKFHKRKGKTFVELLPEGYQVAKRLMSRVYPAPNGWYRQSHQRYPSAPSHSRSNLSSASATSWSNQIVLAMDFREGGGATRGLLHQMCNDLDSIQLPYFVASLSIGDYCFFHGEKLLPVLMERKSIEDLAQSIYDGRWQSQKKRMYQGQYVFGYEKAILIYIVEGKQEHHLVTGGFIGNTRFKISLERVNEEIAKLGQDGFEVLRTASPSSTLDELSKWAKKIDQQVQKGELVPKYTYKEFKEEVAKIPPNVDFSRIAKDHYQRRKEREVQETIITLDSDDDSDEEMNLPTVSKGNPTLPVPAKSRAPTSSAAVRPIAPTTSAAAAIALEIKKRTSSAFPKVEHPDYSKWKRDELVKECLQFGLTKSGSRNDLIQRLQGPRPPSLWIQRKTKGHWVPARPDSSGTALLVAMLLMHQEFPSEREGFRKADISKKADSLNISKEPFMGGKKSFGQYYDGWSSCGYCRKDPPLVEKGKLYKFRLTNEGLPLAQQLHEWCHVHNTCSCKDM